ncbi:TIGR02611 family protein [Mycolicibacterium celeriflavum]|uniref:TIGR02611 family protein n=1 Tax=Mycolicibacterium celeriflavum TaxID=1249101 RepID=UPI003CFB66F1
MNTGGVKERLGRWRERVRQRRTVNFGYRIAVGVVGTVILGLGIVAIPYPGPGWAIVFVGLGILATEFEWARRLLGYVKERYDKAMDWFHRQHGAVQILGGVFTALVVFATLWVLGAVAFFGDLVGLEHKLLQSPLGIGS